MFHPVGTGPPTVHIGGLRPGRHFHEGLCGFVPGSFHDPDVRVLRVDPGEPVRGRLEEHTVILPFLLLSAPVLLLTLITAVLFVIVPWPQRLLGLGWFALEPLLVAAECAQVYAVGLCESAVTRKLEQGLHHRRVLREVHVDVSAWTWHFRKFGRRLVAVALGTLTERHFHCFFLEYPLLDIIPFLIDLILAGSRVVPVARMCVRCRYVIDPLIVSLRLAHKALHSVVALI